MKRLSHLLVCGALLGAMPACGSDDEPGGGGTGGNKGTGGASAGTGGASVGTGGASAGTGGSSAGTGGTGSGDAGGDVGGPEGGDAVSDVPGDDVAGGDAPAGTMSFFVSSSKSMTGNLGGLAGADQRCKDLAEAAGVTGKTWAAYLSTEKGGPADGPINAKDRIGAGPWFNAKGAMVAAHLVELHTRKGDYRIFIDETGKSIGGQWAGSPAGVEHDILTGSKADGTVMPLFTCADWTSEAGGMMARVGHSDGLGPNMDTSMGRDSWNSAHDNGGCNNTTPRGGAGRIYCFAK